MAIIALLTLLCINSVNAQFFESGTVPSSVRWQQIHTENFRIIFPESAAFEGQRAANVLEYIHKAGGKSLNNYPDKIPVVLHNHTAFSNGFVTWAPKRSEFFLTPPQDNSAHEWISHLAVHEYRHVVQIDKLNQGVTRGMGFIVGQQAVGAVAGMLPRWFLEGDAVAAETALTNAGRGRNPAFEMPLRAIALSGNYHKYDKALFGSYRDHVPNQYELGYQMIAWTRERYGEQTFETAVGFVARKPYNFFRYPFSVGLRKTTGSRTGKLYNQAFADLTERWIEQKTLETLDRVEPLTKRTNNLFTNYRSPQYVNDSVFVALKTGIAQIAQLVKVYGDGREEILHVPGFINSDRISYSNGLITWTEHIQDARWTNRTYSIVKLYDLETGRERTLQRRSRHFSPTISPDGETIAVVEVPIEGACSIVLFNTATGEETVRLPNAGGAFLQTPSWSSDGNSLLVIVNDDRGKSIERIDVETGLKTTVLPPTFHDISYPADGGSHAFFNGYYNGITNIYAVNYTTGEIMQVTAARFGAFDPQPNAAGSSLVYASYSANGYDIVETNLNTTRWTPIQQLTDNSLKMYETLVRQENFNMQDSIIPNRQFDVKPYRKWANMFNVHSWAPLYYEIDVNDPAAIEFYPGVVFFSQDLLGNLTSSVGYSWRDDFGALHAKFTFKGLYPMFDFKIDYGGNVLITRNPDDVHPPNASAVTRTNMEVRSYIPFNLTRSRWITGVTPQIRLSYENNYFYSTKTGQYQYGLNLLRYEVTAHRYLKTSLRDLAPRLGIMAQGAYLHAPWNDQFGQAYLLFGRIFLPGVARHHSLRISGAWRHEKPKDFMTGSLLPIIRGYNLQNYRYSEKLIFGSIDYSLPLFYPDWSLSTLVYIKRFHANLFCDVAQNRYRLRNGGQKDDLLSLGVDLFTDVHLLRIAFPLNIGVRTAYVPETRDIQPSLLFRINFY